MTTVDIDRRAELIPGEALRLVTLASAEALTLRIAGSVAVGLQCADRRATLVALGRRPYHDIDFWAFYRDLRRLEEFFAAQGYVADPSVRRMHEWGVKRLVFDHPESEIKVDVFMDELVMAHTIAFRDRLSLGEPCVTVADLVLSKLQIHEITENDLLDLAALLLAHDDAALDVDHVMAVICADWGFSYEAGNNLGQLRLALDRYDALGDADRQRLAARIDGLVARLETEPKGRRWRLRARVGTRKRWYEVVDDVAR